MRALWLSITIGGVKLTPPVELVGTLPYNPPEKDREVIREAIERLVR